VVVCNDSRALRSFCTRVRYTKPAKPSVIAIRDFRMSVSYPYSTTQRLHNSSQSPTRPHFDVTKISLESAQFNLDAPSLFPTRSQSALNKLSPALFTPQLASDTTPTIEQHHHPPEHINA
jgi:hypothetical protein